MMPLSIVSYYPKQINNVVYMFEDMSFESVSDHLLRSLLNSIGRVFILILFYLLYTHHIQHMTGNGDFWLKLLEINKV